MSHAHDDHAEAHGADAHHDDAHHDDFDPEPVQELSPGEPRTPGWVPALGLAFFVSAAIGLLVVLNDDEAEAGGKPEGKSPAAAVVPAGTPQRALPLPGAGAPPGGTPLPVRPVPPPIQLQNPGAEGADGQPGGAAARPARRLTPEQMKMIQQQIEKARQQQEQGAPSPAPAQPPPQGR
ncbi:hypothetical protein [Chondromyces crocatus]|uniref:Uncharacterized protein n=1 Tax=Chondromyces crocatus TaxID=52 RepID=A0A0K1ESZ0_CHOCO|nr:hypothetical protein [Chondromyces crocatus]AKT44050.1 uncharacterized protein CMC5_082880 [Chondromyces crocatus]